MSNVLNTTKQEQVIALGRLGWSARRIEKETGVRRETASVYLKAAGIQLRPAGRWGHAPPKPAIEAPTDSQHLNRNAAHKQAHARFTLTSLN
jgi:hypothetical protein